MRMAAIVYSSDNIHWTRRALEFLTQNTSPDTEIILIDNGSTPPYSVVDEGIFLPLAHRIIRYEENIGGNAVFHRWFEDDWFNGNPPEFLAFLHCDLMVREVNWDRRVIEAFEADPLLQLVGFVGSTQIDGRGGRGGGTMLNYRGDYYTGYGQASPSAHHGRAVTGLEPAAVVDHAAMILRRDALLQLPPQEGNYAPEHFYDRILSCEVLRNGGHIAVLGIDCDHFSGGIGDGMAKADALRRRWLESEGINYDPADTYTAVYLESERRFFAEFRGFFPLSVTPNYEVVHG